MENGTTNRIFNSFMKLKKSVISIHTGELTHAMINTMLAVDTMGAEDGTSATLLCRRMGISMPALARTIKELESRGYVLREHDKTDRRISYVKLTEQGKNQLVTGKREIDRRINKMLELLGEEDTENMIRILDKISDIAEQIKLEDVER